MTMIRPNPRPGLRVVQLVIGLTAAAAGVLALLSQTLSVRTNLRLFAESGPFERLSPWLWLLLAAVIVGAYRRMSPGVIAGVIVCLACAAREWDMHKSFTGYSVLKPGFYMTTEHPLSHQLVAGLIVLALGASVVILLCKLVRLRPWVSSPRPAWLQALGFAVIMLALTKVLDRTPGILRGDFGIELAGRALLLFGALEEGLEMLLPLYFAGLVLSFAVLMRTGHHRFEPAHPPGR